MDLRAPRGPVLRAWERWAAGRGIGAAWPLFALLAGRAYGGSGFTAAAMAWVFASAWPGADTRVRGSWQQRWEPWLCLALSSVGAWWAGGARAFLPLVVVAGISLLWRGQWANRPVAAAAATGLTAAVAALLYGPSPLIAGAVGAGVGAAVPLALFQGILAPFAVRAAASLEEGESGAGAAGLLRGAAIGIGLAGIGGGSPLRLVLQGGLLAAFLLWTEWRSPSSGGAPAGAAAGCVALAMGAGTPVAMVAAAALAGAAAPPLAARARLGAPLGVSAATFLVCIITGTGWWWCAGTALVALVLALVVGQLPVHHAPDPHERPAVGGDLLDRLRASAVACLELSQGLAQSASAEPVPLSAEREGLRVAEEVCPGCPSLRSCWERRLPRAQRLVAQAWERASDGGLRWQDVGGEDTLFCLRPREIAEIANRHAALQRQRQEMQRLIAASRRSAVGPLLSIGRVLSDLADEVAAASAGQTGGALAPPAARSVWNATSSEGCWGYAAASASLARAGAAVSGDAVRCRILEGDRLALVVSDGMGSGPLAAVASAAAAEHVLAWLAAGRSAEEALSLTNERLAEEGGAERLATVDLAIVHLRTGIVEWWKMGAPPAYVLQSRGVREVGAGGLPAGVLLKPEIRFMRSRIRPGEAVLLLTDGVLDRPRRHPFEGRAGTRGRGAWVHDWLRSRAAPVLNASEVAVALVEEARRRRGTPHDDLTVLAAVLTGPAATSRDEGARRAPAAQAAAASRA